MDITNNTVLGLIACYEKTLDPRMLCVLDMLCEKKTIVPLQRAFRKKRNGTCVPKTENIFTKQPTQ